MKIYLIMYRVHWMFLSYDIILSLSGIALLASWNINFYAIGFDVGENLLAIIFAIFLSFGLMRNIFMAFSFLKENLCRPGMRLSLLTE